MKLHLFLSQNMEEILAEWVAFARTQEPAADTMSLVALRDHAKAILTAIALDIETRQNPAEQKQKSQGLGPDAPGGQSAASTHGELRQASHFTLLQLSAEFRALRATVLRLWLPRVGELSPDTIDQMVRFNEAIDQALAESIVTFTARADKTRELFLAILGHDLRAPLSTVLLAGELLGKPNLDAELASTLAGRVKRSARLMSSMVDDLLGFTRTQLSGGMPVVLRNCDVDAVCRAAIEDAQATHPQAQFELTSAGVLDGQFDPVRLHQLFTNLLVNAGQYGSKDKPVLIDLQGHAEGLTVRITNQGEPIPEHALKLIFDLLIQLQGEPEGGEESRPHTSLGLGLFVARAIAQAHGGSIGVTSDVQQGTTFTVRLPRLPHLEGS